MRISISADNDNGLDSVISPHFGRCPFFVIVQVEGTKVQAVEVVQNPYYDQHQPGQVPGFIHGHGVDVMLTGGMGRRAIGFFQQYGIEPVTGAAGTARMALERYLGGELRGVAPCKESVEHTRNGQYEKDKVARLREEAEMLQATLDEVAARLDKLG